MCRGTGSVFLSLEHDTMPFKLYTTVYLMGGSDDDDDVDDDVVADAKSSR